MDFEWRTVPVMDLLKVTKTEGQVTDTIALSPRQIFRVHYDYTVFSISDVFFVSCGGCVFSRRRETRTNMLALTFAPLTQRREREVAMYSAEIEGIPPLTVMRIIPRSAASLAL